MAISRADGGLRMILDELLDGRDRANLLRVVQLGAREEQRGDLGFVARRLREVGLEARAVVRATAWASRTSSLFALRTAHAEIPSTSPVTSAKAQAKVAHGGAVRTIGSDETSGFAYPCSGSSAASALGRMLSRAVPASSIFPRALASALFAASACAPSFTGKTNDVATEVEGEARGVRADDVRQVLDRVRGEAWASGRR